jgi:hypothetical protein
MKDFDIGVSFIKIHGVDLDTIISDLSTNSIVYSNSAIIIFCN